MMEEGSDVEKEEVKEVSETIVGGRAILLLLLVLLLLLLLQLLLLQTH